MLEHFWFKVTTYRGRIQRLFWNVLKKKKTLFIHWEKCLMQLFSVCGLYTLSGWLNTFKKLSVKIQCCKLSSYWTALKACHIPTLQLNIAVVQGCESRCTPLATAWCTVFTQPANCWWRNKIYEHLPAVDTSCFNYNICYQIMYMIEDEDVKTVKVTKEKYFCHFHHTLSVCI